MEPNINLPGSLGFYSADGFFQPLALLSAKSLEFVSKSQAELEALLQEYVLEERYEKCAVIRDELLKRKAA